MVFMSNLSARKYQRIDYKRGIKSLRLIAFPSGFQSQIEATFRYYNEIMSAGSNRRSHSIFLTETN